MAANQPPEQKRTLPRRGRPYRRAIEIPPVGACFARPRNDHRSFPTFCFSKSIPKPKPSDSGFGLERRGKAAVPMAANQPPEQKRTLPRRGRPYRRAIEIPPVGACFARPRNDHRSFPTFCFSKSIPKPKPSDSGFGLERRGKAAVPMAANQPPEQKRTLPRRGRPYRRAIEIPPVGACFARPRNDRRSFPTPHFDSLSQRATTGRPYAAPSKFLP